MTRSEMHPATAAQRPWIVPVGLTVLSPDFSLTQLPQEQCLQRHAGTDTEEMHAPRLAEFTKALDKILHGPLVDFETELAEGDFLAASGLGIDQTQVTGERRIQFVRREELQRTCLKAATNECRNA